MRVKGWARSGMDRKPGSRRSSIRLLVARLGHRWWLRRRSALIIFGAVLFVAGVVVLFVTDHVEQSAFLLAAGFALVLGGALGSRVELESFDVLGANLRVREVVTKRLEAAESRESDRAADPSTLRRQAAVLQRLLSLHRLYEHIRRMEPPGPRRTANLDQLAASMRTAGADAQFQPSEVIEWFHEGTDALRVIALNLMLPEAAYRDFVVVMEAIDLPHSLFEQYYGLHLAEEMLPGLNTLERRLLSDALARARRKRRFKRDLPLMQRSNRLRDQLAKRA